MILTEEERLQHFLAGRKSFRYRKGEIILRAGDVAQGVMFLKEGYAKLETVSKEGKSLTLVVYRPDEFFPVVWTFFGRNPSIYDIEALTDCELIRISRDELSDFLMRYPDVLVNITKHIITRFQLALRRMTYLAFGNADSKLASILLICAMEFGIAKNDEIEIQIPLTHKDIASLVGVTRETVSIELKKFDKKKYIDYRKKKIVIKNKVELRKKAIF